MTRFPGSGLLKRIETPEWYFSLRPEVRRVTEYIEQLLARLAVEARVVRQLLQHDHEAGLRARFVDQIGHAVEQRVEVLAEVGGKQERFGDALQHLLLRLGVRQVRVEEMLADALGGLHQVLDAV